MRIRVLLVRRVDTAVDAEARAELPLFLVDGLLLRPGGPWRPVVASSEEGADPLHLLRTRTLQRVVLLGREAEQRGDYLIRQGSGTDVS
mmetsp:Transcript_3995/g.11061  ORF Transcript_3995/g.11061 Transcript_3995/m.11061 type:complete len:89 (-) Transcript_3995:178-444(-)|eukprot:scaffold139660_cov29-Tisochrysis_lutea.AAC.1